MALSLDKISQNKKQKSDNTSIEEFEAKKIVRPWEKNNDIQNSFSGNQALNRAKEIVTKNNTMVEDLRRAGAQEKNIEAIERLIREKEIEFENLEKKDFNQRKIASNKGILGRMKNLFYTN